MSDIFTDANNCEVPTDALTVLLVDDEPHIRNVMAYKLKKQGLNVITAENGVDGFDSARHLQPDLIVSDMQMPHCTGLDMCKRLAGDSVTGAIPIIMVTSREFEIGPVEIAGTSIRAVIGKPFSPTELLKLVQTHLPSKRSA